MSVRRKRVIGAVLAAGGGVAIGYAITGMGSVGDCGYPGVPVCPPSVGSDMYLMGGGVIALAVGAALTWGVGILFGLLGAGVTGIAKGSAVLSLATLLPLALIVVFGARAGRQATDRAGARAEAAQRAGAEELEFKESAARTTGTVSGLEDTGRTINDSPVATVAISYTRADGSPATVRTTQALPRLAIPRPGDQATVWYDADQAVAELETTPVPESR